MQLPFWATEPLSSVVGLHQCTRSTHSRRRMVPPEPDQFRLEKLGRAPSHFFYETLTRDSLIHKVCFGTVSSRIHNCCPKQIKFSCSISRTQKNKFFQMVQQQWWRFSSEGITELRASYVAIAAPGCSRSMYVEEALQCMYYCVVLDEGAGRGSEWS